MRNFGASVDNYILLARKNFTKVKNTLIFLSTSPTMCHDPCPPNHISPTFYGVFNLSSVCFSICRFSTFYFANCHYQCLFRLPSLSILLFQQSHKADHRGFTVSLFCCCGLSHFSCSNAMHGRMKPFNSIGMSPDHAIYRI